ncbi:MAG: hypothetical protein KDB01_18715 [Planctomycetaceae bacterium]|nr:hypothetical protein [Planctomycetaceae bacterium]
MSRRTSKSSQAGSSAIASPVETADSQNSGNSPVPSLESLLASCGALQSVLKHVDAPEEIAAEPEPESNDIVGSAECVAEESNEGAPTPDVPVVEQDNVAANDVVSTESAGWIESLRHEFRSSIDELKATQAAAAASQSAVLKTLTEIIFQSSTSRDSSESGLEKKLAEFEDRILNRIVQIGGLTGSGEISRTSAAFNEALPVAKPHGGESVKKNQSRSWAEIRNALVTQGENGGTDFGNDQPEARGEHSVAAEVETESSEPDYIVDIPEVIDPDSLTEQELRAVFHEREGFIATLIGRLRHLHQKSSGHLPAEQLKHMAEHLPEELAAQVLQTLQQLNELARIGELELSLERARLSRQVNQLAHTRQLLEHNARQIGLTIEEDGTVLNPQNLTLRNGGSRRWLSKLGFGL